MRSLNSFYMDQRVNMGTRNYESGGTESRRFESRMIDYSVLLNVCDEMIESADNVLFGVEKFKHSKAMVISSICFN